jgi:PAB-dependent poly(A)-specific ribonuclease subunit 3
VPEKIREDMHKKSHATLQVMPPTAMPLPVLEHYHSLFPLDTSSRKNAAIFGYTSWVYKATSSRNGRYYCLRRLDGA